MTARITERMSKGFLRPGLASSEKISPTVVNVVPAPAWGSAVTSRSIGSVVNGGSRPGLARLHVAVVVVREEDVDGADHVRRPVLGLPVRDP